MIYLSEQEKIFLLIIQDWRNRKREREREKGRKRGREREREIAILMKGSL